MVEICAKIVGRKAKATQAPVNDEKRMMMVFQAGRRNV